MNDYEKYKKSHEGYRKGIPVYNVAEESKRETNVSTEKPKVKVIDKYGNVINVKDISQGSQEEQIGAILESGYNKFMKKIQNNELKVRKSNKKYKGRKLDLKRVLAVMSVGALAIGGLYIKSNNDKIKEAEMKEFIYQRDIDDKIDYDIYIEGFSDNRFVNNIMKEEENAKVIVPDNVEEAAKTDAEEFSIFCKACLDYNEISSREMTNDEADKLLALEVIIKQYASSGKLKQVSIDVIRKKMELARENGDYISPKSVIDTTHLNKDSQTGEKVMYVSDKVYNLNDKEQCALPETLYDLANDILEFPEPRKLSAGELNLNISKYATMGEHLSRVTMSNYILDKEGIVKRVNNEDYEKQVNRLEELDEFGVIER